MRTAEISQETANIRLGRRLEHLTIGWNCVEALVAIASGVMAGSIALVGFGLDSVIEVGSGATVLWRLSDERRERRALQLVGLSFLGLAVYVLVESARDLWGHQAPERSLPGIAIAAASVLVMPLLARAKRRVASSLGSRAMHADSRQTDLCAYLSGILLVGLVLNAAVGWWWADPVAGLLMVPIIANEAREALRGERCCEE